MASAQELFKQAIMGISSSRSPGVRIKTMGEECASEIVSNPSRDKVSIVAERARTAGLNKNQIARLVEVTNHAMLKPVLRSQARGDSRPIVSKNDVFKRMAIDDKASDPEYQHNEFSAGTFNPNQTAEPARMPKTASLSKLAIELSSSELSDYHQEPMTLGDFPREEFVPEEAVPSQKEISKTAGYAAEKREDVSAELEFLELQYHAAAGSFAKTASQYVLTGTPFEDVVAASIQYKPDKSTVALLKTAANTCFKRGLFTKEELGTWIDSLDYIKEANPGFEKMAGLGIPVSDSLIAKDLKGRVRIMNGNSHVIRMLDTVGRIEDRIRKARLIKEQIPDKQITRELKRRVSNVSDY